MDSKVVTAWFKEIISSIIGSILKEIHVIPIIIVLFIVLLLIIFRKN